jgi:hypothetical protein
MANMRDITFGTFNLYNLQRPDWPMYAQSRLYTQDEYDLKLDFIVRTILRLDSDVIAFQEAWSPESLGDVFADPRLSGQYELAFIKDGGWDGIAVAAAVRQPWRILSVQRHKAFPPEMKLKKRKRTMAAIRANPPAADREVDADQDPEFVPSHEDEGIEVAISEFSRSPLQVTIGHSRARNPSVPPIHVFCTHLKSKLSTPLDNEEYRDAAIRPHREALGGALSTIRRTAEAAALRIILNKTMTGNDEPVVVLGDINDGQFSNTVSVLSGQPSFRVIQSSTAGRRSDHGLYSGVTLQQLRSLADVYYTHEFKNVREVIDHVLVSEQFYDYSDKRHWSFRDMQFLNDHIDQVERHTTDHGLVRATFVWKPNVA